MADYLLHHNANTHWRYPTSEETDRLIAASRAALADFLGASPDEIAFGANMTTLTFHLARALGRRWGPGDEIVVTELDHHANVAPWRRSSAERGVTHPVRPARCPRPASWTGPRSSGLLSPRTRLLAIGAASNALGTINDVTRACALARAAGALTFVDAVHYAPHAPSTSARSVATSSPARPTSSTARTSGVLYGRRDRVEALDVPKLAPAPDTAPERLETGTLNHEGIVGAGAAVDFLASLAAAARDRHAARLRRQRSAPCMSGAGRWWSGCGRGWRRSGG